MAIRTRWFDEKVEVKAEVATAGDLIVPGVITKLPFQTGGVSGMPLGFTMKVDLGNASWVTFTTNSGLNRFSGSTNQATETQETGYRCTYLVPVKATDYLYRVSVKARTMEGKSTGRVRLDLYYYNNGVEGPRIVTGPQVNAGPDWTAFSAAVKAVDPQYNQLGIVLYFSSLSATFPAVPPAGWGVQYTELEIKETYLLAPVVPTAWQDLTCDLRSIQYRYGRERFTNRYDVGSGTLVLNNDDGAYTYKTPHPFNLRPGRQVRITATYDKGTPFPLFFGIIDTITEGYSIEGHAISTWTLLDPSTLLSTSDTPTVSQAYMLGVPANVRIGMLLDIAGYLNYSTAYVGESWRMQFIQASGRTIRDEIGVTTDSEGSSLITERNGSLYYRNRDYLQTTPELNKVTANLAAGDFGAEVPPVDNVPTLANAPTLFPNGMNNDWSRARVTNHVELAYVGGTVRIYEDVESQKRNGIMTYQRLDFVLGDATGSPPNINEVHLDTRANDIMSGYGDPVLRVNSVSFRPTGGSKEWTWVLSVFLNWLVRVYYQHPTEWWGYAAVTHVQSIEHRISLDDWEVTLAVDSVTKFSQWQVVYTKHGWDDALWDVDLWDQTD